MIKNKIIIKMTLERMREKKNLKEARWLMIILCITYWNTFICLFIELKWFMFDENHLC